MSGLQAHSLILGQFDNYPPGTWTDPGEVRPMERLGRYEVLWPLGRGGVATVYLARTPVVGSLHREVALKVMHPHLQADPIWVSNLIDEARLAARVQHANVVSVIEVGESPFGLYLAMPYIEGESLAYLVRTAARDGGLLPPGIAGRILCDALLGLHAAHQQVDESGRPLELVHRDFSPQNVLVGLDGLSRLSDFGIAKAINRVTATDTGV